MSLSERLRAAEIERQRQADLLNPPEAVVDLSDGDEPVVDLIDRSWDLRDPVDPGSSAGAGISYDPVRSGEPGTAFGEPGSASDAEARISPIPCPRCGGATQVDLFDQVHQTFSLSCTTCFHMFRHEV